MTGEMWYGVEPDGTEWSLHAAIAMVAQERADERLAAAEELVAEIENVAECLCLDCLEQARQLRIAIACYKNVVQLSGNANSSL